MVSVSFEAIVNIKVVEMHFWSSGEKEYPETGAAKARGKARRPGRASWLKGEPTTDRTRLSTPKNPEPRTRVRPRDWCLGAPHTPLNGPPGQSTP